MEMPVDMSRVDRWVVRVLFGLYLAGLLAWLLLGLVPVHVANPDMAHEALDRTTGLETAVQYVFSALNLALGVLLFLRRPDQLVPRLLAFALLGTAATFNLPSHRVFHLIGSPWPIAMLHFTFHIVSGVAYVWAVMLFPDGRLPNRVRLSAPVLRIVALVTTAGVAVVCWHGSFVNHPQFFLAFFGIAVSLVGGGAQLLRILDPATTPRERATARLLCAGLLPALAVALLWLGAWAAGELTGSGVQAAAIQASIERLFPAVFAIVPVVLFAGVVRYRLWDIDRLLSRILVYGLLALLLGAAYVFAVAVGGHLAGGGLWLTTLTLSAVAVLVEPLRVVGRRWANRVVFGQVLSPTEAIRALVGSLEHLSPAKELEHIVAVFVAATRAMSAGLWLVEEDRLVLAASAPEDAAPDEVLLTGADRSTAALTAAVHARRGWPIRHHGELLGLLAVRLPAGERFSPADENIGSDIAAQAGLLVHNATLTVTLARQVEALAARAAELAVLRRRLVAAQDAERRILERALHDGAQQALVAAIIAARAGGETGTVPPQGRDELRQLLRIAARDIDELSGDGRPTVLRRLGLSGGLQDAARLARRSGLGVQVVIDPQLGAGPDPLPTEVETAVYFACLEGLQNVSKYAAATTVTVRVRSLEGQVCFSVADDGTGLAPVSRGDGGGVADLVRRFSALGGWVRVTSRAQGGTELLGALPIPLPIPRPAGVGP
ncbi:MAG: hypothetical protein L0H79_12805 [Intrasporangium sp.]|uniref:GAF domain-containing sensor histidine kinase n=1 Tax=Intrasporangium sp. TaxID=1925024 RepID=UPI0026486533|nr:ATP-binding protein [Intrasporangium sp.]MDN5796620.1 hypothetical protein [Intrasporangium sp.]